MTENAFAGTSRFRVERRLGAGANGVVYQAVDRDTGASVALKTLRQLAPSSLLQLKHEFRALQNIEHPNLVSLGELIEADGRWFFTMELVDGCDVVSYVRGEGDASVALADTVGANDERVSRAERVEVRGGACDPERVRRCLEQLVHAVAALHDRQCVHRDIKPSNILVDRAGRLVLCDFGLLAEIRARESGAPTDQVVGTALYMAPEQAARGAFGPAADWYGVGAVLYEMLVGRPPFVGANLEVMVRKQSERAPSAHSVAAVPRSLSQLADDLLAINPAARPGPDAILERLGSRRSRTARLRALDSEPRAELIGRDAELAELEQHALGGEGPALCTVHGASGIGKSALLEALAARCRERGAQVLVGRCFESESVPFKAVDGVVDQLAARLAALPADVRTALLPAEASLLRRAFPVLGQVIPLGARPAPGSPAADPHDLRTRTFAAMRELVAGVVRLGPVVIIIDDFQWADSDGIALLRAVLRPPSAPAVRLVLGSREPTASALGEGLRLGARDIALEGLSADHAAELARRLWHRFVGGESAPQADALAREADGSPLYVSELVRYLATVDGSGSSPPSLERALAARVAGVSADAARLLELISVAGAPLTQAVLRDAAGAQIEVFTPALASLRAAHLVRGNGVRQDDTVEPYHGHVRAAVLAGLEREPLRERHLLLAAAIAAGPSVDERAEVLSFHLEAGGELDQAAHYAEEAAQRARRVFAFDRAAQQLSRALRLGNHGEAKEHELLHQLADCLAVAGRGPESAATYEQLAASAKTADRLQCRMLAAEQYLIFGHLEKGQRALEKVLAHVGASLAPTPKRALVRLVYRRAHLRLRGLGWRERAAAEVPGRDLARVDAFAAVAVGMGLVDTVRSAEFQTRGLLAALAVGEPARVGRAMFYEAIASAMRGPRGFGRGRALLDRARRIGEDLGDPYLHALGVATDGMISYFEGAFPRAVDQLLEGERMLRDQGRRAWGEINVDRTFQLFSLRMMGRVDELAHRASQYVWDAERRGDRYSATTFRRTSYLGVLAEADYETARREVEQSRWTTPPDTWHLQDYFELHAVTELALYRGEAGDLLDGYTASYREFERSLIPRAVQITRCEALFLWGRIALAHRDRERGLAVAESVSRRLARERIGFAEVWSELLAGTAHHLRGHTDRAREALLRCIERAGVLGMELCAASAHWRLGDIAGGERGREHRRHASAWATRRGVSAADALFATMSPGG